MRVTEDPGPGVRLTTGGVTKRKRRQGKGYKARAKGKVEMVVVRKQETFGISRLKFVKILLKSVCACVSNVDKQDEGSGECRKFETPRSPAEEERSAQNSSTKVDRA